MLGFRPATMPSGPVIPDYSLSSQNAMGGPIEHRFSPYQENHGSVVAIAGKDFAVIASDTRLSGQRY